MKRIIKLLVVIVGLVIGLQAKSQVYSNQNVVTAITNESPFLDGSSSFNDLGDNRGKGLVFPQTDLTQFTFVISALDGFLFPTAFDGMLVYNVGTGNTKGTQGAIVSPVTPGYYYFSNPDGLNTTSIVGGKWVRFTDQMPSSEKSYFGVLATNAPTATDVTGLTPVTLASSLYVNNFNLTIGTAGYYTMAVPAAWRNPLLKLNGDGTLDIMQAVKQVVIGGVNYVVWQSDIPLPVGQVVSIN